MIKKLLRKNISPLQLCAYAIANLVGLAILLVSLQFYRDVTSGKDDQDGDAMIGRDYLVLSKPVPLLSVFGNNSSATEFSDEEITEIEEQPWVRKLGKFTAADFNVSASVEFAGRGISTAMFFESLPDEFVDTPLDQWSFDPDKAEIPIIIPRDYLALYNFGFASSRGMPQLSEDLLAQIPLTIILSGNGHRELMSAHIVGLSSRLNTIAVPNSFMTWANERYSSQPDSKHSPSRLIIEVENPGDPQIASWLDEHGVETSADKLNSGKTAYLATIASAVVGSIGIVISFLSILILMLSILLIIQKNRDKIRDLILLGYYPRRIAGFYNSIVIKINAIITIGSIAIMFAVSSLWKDTLNVIGLECASPWLTILISILIMSVVTLVSFAIIRRTISLTQK